MVGENPDWKDAARHGCKQNRGGEHGANRHPKSEVSDLSLALGHLVVFGQLVRLDRDIRLGAARVAVRSSDGGCCSVTVGARLDDQLAVDHVHPAGEPKLTGTVRQELDGRLPVSRERRVQGKVRKNHPRGALAALLAVEDDPQGYSLAYSH